MNRALLVKVHRWTGLALALLLAVLGLTGSIIVFDAELDTWLNPQLFEIDRPGETPLPAAELIRRVEASDPRIEAYYLALSDEPREASVAYVAPRIDPRSGEAFEVDFDEVFIDPVSGRITGRRLWGECCFEPQNFVPFMYKLHNRLLLPLDIGRPLLGVASAAWLVLLIVGVWITWPVSARWRDWRRAWSLRSGRTGLQTLLNAHRGGGLWLWPVLFMLAVTGAALGFEDSVRNVVHGVSPLSSPPEGEAVPRSASVSVSAAVAAARRSVEAQRRALSPSYVRRSDGIIRVRFGDPYAAGLEEITAYVSAADGRVLALERARGESAGDLVMNAIQPLHAGRIAGFPGRVLVFLGGLAVAALSITGVWMWCLRHARRTRRVNTR